MEATDKNLQDLVMENSVKRIFFKSCEPLLLEDSCVYIGPIFYKVGGKLESLSLRISQTALTKAHFIEIRSFWISGQEHQNRYILKVAY
jgi:hypothetical protein